MSHVNNHLELVDQLPELFVEKPTGATTASLPGLSQDTSVVPEAVLSWRAAVREAIDKAWEKPDLVDLGESCQLTLVQDAGGRVIGATLRACDAEDPLRDSLLAAVYRASPLPAFPGPRGIVPHEVGLR